MSTDTPNTRSPRSPYTALGLIGSVLIFVASILTLKQMAAAGAVLYVLAGLLVLALGISRLMTRDEDAPEEATLIPVLDPAFVRAQYQRAAQVAAELISLAPSAPVDHFKSAIGRLVLALDPLMSLGGVTIESASVSGYPPYPEVAQTPMIGDDTDFVSFHLLRIDASLRRLEREVNAPLPAIQKVAAASGEFIPPLRAIKAVIEQNS